jgi:class 3 adenylate cyclase
MIEHGPASVQYVFLDVVSFTQNRSVEAQTDVINTLNAIAKNALEQNGIAVPDCILLPTGDGIAIAVLKTEPFDLSLQIAQSIIASLHSHNNSTQDPKRKFEIRVGVNQNIDNIIVDINGNTNVAGRGINMAQRVMSHADGGQIILGQSVFEILRERESYENSFRELPGKDKHGNRFPIYQFIRSNVAGLNTEIPSQLRTATPTKPSLNEYTAHFIAHASRHHGLLMSRRTEHMFENAATILLHLLTRDSMENINKNPLLELSHRMPIDSSGSLEGGFDSICKSEFWTVAEFSYNLRDKLWDMREFFERGDYQVFWPFPTEQGKQIAREKFAKIWAFIMEQPDN